MVRIVDGKTHCKVVLCGPPHAGKRTIVEWLHHDESVHGVKSELHWSAIGQDRVLSFELSARMFGLDVCVEILTMPGEIYSIDDLRRGLEGVDGILFVADSHKRRLDEDLESTLTLEAHLRSLGLAPDTLPWTFVWNKRDLPHVLPTDRLEAALNPAGRASAEAVAISGEGLGAAFKNVIQQITASLSKEYGLGAKDHSTSATPPSFGAPPRVSKPRLPMPSPAAERPEPKMQARAGRVSLDLSPPEYRSRAKKSAPMQSLTRSGASLGAGLADFARALASDKGGAGGATFERSATVRYFSQMYRERTYPLMVVLSQNRIQDIVMEAVEQVRSDQTLTIKEENPFLNIRVLLPGCLLSPNEQELDVTAPIAEARFWVTPLSIGAVEAAKVEIRYEGVLVDTIALPIRVTRQTLAKFSASTSLATPALKPLLSSESFQSALAEFGADFSQQALGWISAYGIWPIAASFAGLACVFFVYFKPRKAEPIESFFNLEEEAP